MIVLIDTCFEKDTDSIKDKKLLYKIADKIEEIQHSDSLKTVASCKKLTGSKNAYRIRIGDYRIGFLLENDTVDLIRFLHRSKIYDFFPD